MRPTTPKSVFAALLGALALLPPAPDVGADPASERRVVVPRAGSPDEVSGRPVVVEIDGNERPVIDLSPAGDWTLVVAVDPPLSSRLGAQRAGALLAARAARLVHLGEVRVLIVDTLLEERLGPSRDIEAATRALSSIPGSGAFGDVLSRRAGLSPDADRLERIEAARDELQLVRWQREALVDWLLTAEIEGPRALFLLQDAFDMGQQEAYGLNAPLQAGSPSPVLDDRLLGPTLAAAGWAVYPLDLNEAIEGVRSGEGHQSLARETGGRIVRGAEDLEAALDSLTGAISIDFDLEAEPSGPLRLVIPGVGAGMSPPNWIGGAFLPGRATARARQFLSEDTNGGLDVAAALNYEGPDAESVVVEVQADLEPEGSPPSSSWLSLALYLDQVDAQPLQIELQGDGRSLAGVDRWITQSAVVLPQDPGELVAVVTDGLTGRWGAARVDEEGVYLARRGPGLAIEQFDLRPARTPEEDPREPTVITLLAPRGTELKGRHRFRTLVTAPIVARVVFTLDGEPVEIDEEAPFAARIDLGASVARHTVRIDAFDAMGNPIGSDSIRLNEPARSFDVAFSGVSLGQASFVSLSAEVSHPTDVPVERLEFYFNERLLETQAAPPWSVEARIGGIGQTDYVRVVAYFADGRFLEDVKLLSSLGSTEEVEVNLVQVYVVATDKQGEPVDDLAAENFEIRLRGERQEIERFAYADEVPLLLALVIDTSGSMWALMPDTKKAAGKFLTQVLTDKDQALVIDFDDRPRIAAALTDDIGDLLLSMGSLAAEKMAMTALYDSVIFGALELPSGQQRKAVVLLTDGDDTKSRFSLGRAIDTAKQAGVPVYVVSLAGIHDPRRKAPRTDINALTAQTGGEAFYLGTMGELTTTYALIARELRSQYMLAFPTERQLSEGDIESIRVSVSRPGIETRSVVGGRSVD